MKSKPAPKSENLSKKDNHPKLIGGTILITLGIIIILQNFGLLPWSALTIVARLWPLILVFWGLKMLAR